MTSDKRNQLQTTPQFLVEGFLLRHYIGLKITAQENHHGGNN